eukprot:CAMPEP_0178728276 /NCGR_PEP_ID=MMETSP0699-20121125/28327_1 /TAXON_ID=265572 /ORGANISM="Extubocellulus spinifer, Strain CCMP396" /LENGTH=244 /DNA_ID=CAMNT_0020380079 /DNA_START=69 /DNA_END=804 /DNA_ORIENTATION=+
MNLMFVLLLPLAASFSPLPPQQQLIARPASSAGRSQTYLSPRLPDVSDHTPFSLKWLEDTGESVKKGLAAGVLSLMVTAAGVLSLMVLTNLSQILPADITAANAAGSTVIGEIAGSGIVFKDTLVVEQFDDPKVKGVSLYISNFQKPLAEKISKGQLFSDPSFASVSCARTGPITIADNIAKGKQGEEVFEESKSLLFKTLRVQRIYDEERGVVVYVSFNTRLDKNSDSNKARFKSSTCAIGLN